MRVTVKHNLHPEGVVLIIHRGEKITDKCVPYEINNLDADRSIHIHVSDQSEIQLETISVLRKVMDNQNKKAVIIYAYDKDIDKASKDSFFGTIFSYFDSILVQDDYPGIEDFEHEIRDHSPEVIHSAYFTITKNRRDQKGTVKLHFIDPNFDDCSFDYHCDTWIDP